MGDFIQEQRKVKGLTQKQLAEKLNLTDKAISKWERKQGYPDITILPQLAAALDVTTNELLSGKKEESKSMSNITQDVLRYAQKITVMKNHKLRRIIEIIFTVLCMLLMIICVICDFALNKTLTWSLYPITCSIFGWLIMMPFIHFEKHGIEKSMISISLFIFPFLFTLDRIINTVTWFFPLGIPLAITGIIFTWIVWYLVVKLTYNDWYISGFILLAILPLKVIVNFFISNFTDKPFFDIWDALSFAIIIVVICIAFFIGYRRNKLD